MAGMYYRLLFKSIHEGDYPNAVALCLKDKLAECVKYFRDCQESELTEKRDWDVEDWREFTFEPVFTMPEWLGEDYGPKD